MGKLDEQVSLMLLLLLMTFPLIPATRKAFRESKPCKRFVLYYHNVLFGGNDPVNATSANVTAPSGLGDFDFGRLFVFDDPMTRDQHLTSPPVARSQGMYFYNMKNVPNAWYTFSLVFNSSEYRGTINIMGADIITEKTRDLSVVGGTGDFFMTRGIVTVETEVVEGTKYFRLKMDTKLYECY